MFMIFYKMLIIMLHLFSFQEPVKVIPGDQVKTTCIYSTMSVSDNVRFGHSTSDEMCLGFLTYFPKENLKDSYCTNWRNIPLCLLWSKNSETIFEGCHIQRLFQGLDSSANQIIQNIIDTCSPFKICSDWCKYSVDVARLHPCFKGDVLDFIGYENLHDLPKFLIPFIICDFKKQTNFSTEIIFHSKTNKTLETRNGCYVEYDISNAIHIIVCFVFFIFNHFRWKMCMTSENNKINE